MGIRNRNSSERFARAITRPFPALQDGAVPERAVFIGVTMWPAVNRNRQNIATRIEAALSQYPC